MTARAAIFDMDGLLIDSEPLWRRAEVAVFGALGVPLSDAMCRETLGMRLDAAVAHWRVRHPWEGPDDAQVASDLVAAVSVLIESEGRPMPGVEATLDLLAGAGLRFGLASSSPPALIETVVDRLALRDRFEVLCSAVDESAGKPHPAVFLRAAERLGVAPGACIAFEDSPSGIRAARAAGMRVVAVPDPAEADHPDMALADVRLGSLLEFQTPHLG